MIKRKGYYLLSLIQSNFSLFFVFYVSILLLKPIISVNFAFALFPSLCSIPFSTILHILYNVPTAPGLLIGYVALGSINTVLGCTGAGFGCILFLILDYISAEYKPEFRLFSSINLIVWNMFTRTSYVLLLFFPNLKA